MFPLPWALAEGLKGVTFSLVLPQGQGGGVFWMLGRAGREEIALLQCWPALAPNSSEKK